MDGTVDNTFGEDGNGRVVTDINQSDDDHNSLQLDTRRGFIYLGGRTRASSAGNTGPSGPLFNFAMIRYNMGNDVTRLKNNSIKFKKWV